MNKKVTEDEVQKTMDFVKNVLAPTDPELEAAVQQRLDPKYFDGDESKIILPSQVEEKFEDEDVRHVLHVVNARKPVHKMFNTQRDFGSEPINGYTIKLVRGELGMVKPEARGLWSRLLPEFIRQFLSQLSYSYLWFVKS